MSKRAPKLSSVRLPPESCQVLVSYVEVLRDTGSEYTHQGGCYDKNQMQHCCADTLCLFTTRLTHLSILVALKEVTLYPGTAHVYTVERRC